MFLDFIFIPPCPCKFLTSLIPRNATAVFGQNHAAEQENGGNHQPTYEKTGGDAWAARFRPETPCSWEKIDGGLTVDWWLIITCPWLVIVPWRNSDRDGCIVWLVILFLLYQWWLAMSGLIETMMITCLSFRILAKNNHHSRLSTVGCFVLVDGWCIGCPYEFSCRSDMPSLLLLVHSLLLMAVSCFVGCSLILFLVLPFPWKLQGKPVENLPRNFRCVMVCHPVGPAR